MCLQYWIHNNNNHECVCLVKETSVHTYVMYIEDLQYHELLCHMICVHVNRGAYLSQKPTQLELFLSHGQLHQQTASEKEGSISMLSQTSAYLHSVSEHLSLGGAVGLSKPLRLRGRVQRQALADHTH